MIFIWIVRRWILVKSRSLGNLFLGIATYLAAILVTLLPMDAESRLLLEHFLATVDAAHIRIVLGVSINMLHQVLSLREGAITYLALKTLNCFVHVNKVTLQAVKWGECAITIIVQAFNTLLFCILTFKHSLEFILNLSLGFTCQLEANGKAFHIVLVHLFATVLVLRNVVFIKVAKMVACLFLIFCLYHVIFLGFLLRDFDGRCSLTFNRGLKRFKILSGALSHWGSWQMVVRRALCSHQAIARYVKSQLSLR